MCVYVPQGGQLRRRFKSRSRSAEELRLMAADDDDDDAGSLAEVQDSRKYLQF
jgi:hypothetical protein